MQQSEALSSLAVPTRPKMGTGSSPRQSHPRSHHGSNFNCFAPADGAWGLIMLLAMNGDLKLWFCNLQWQWGLSLEGGLAEGLGLQSFGSGRNPGGALDLSLIHIVSSLSPSELWEAFSTPAVPLQGWQKLQGMCFGGFGVPRLWACCGEQGSMALLPLTFTCHFCQVLFQRARLFGELLRRSVPRVVVLPPLPPLPGLSPCCWSFKPVLVILAHTGKPLGTALCSVWGCSGPCSSPFPYGAHY